MNDPRNAVQDTVYDLLNGAGLTALVDPDDSDALPYTVFGDATFTVDAMTTKTTEGTEVVHQCVSWATDPDTAQANANTGLAAITDRTITVSVTGYEVNAVLPDFGGPIIKDDLRPNETYWGVPYRVRFWLTQQ